MSKEIERKFLLKDDSWRAVGGTGVRYCQAYFPLANGVLRVRLAGEQGYITLKSRTQGCTRDEFEYPIPAEDAEAMMKVFAPLPTVDKLRYRVDYAGHTWEIDEFLGVNKGLVIAEIELGSEAEPFVKPPWIGAEVTGDYHYYNSYLAKLPVG